MSAQPPPHRARKGQDPLAEDELTPIEKARFQQAAGLSGAGEILSGFHLYDDDCRRLSARQGMSHWSVAWSDLMMTMFILFVVLYAYQISLIPPQWGERAGRERAAAVIGGERTIRTATINDLSPPNGHALKTIYDESRQVLEQSHNNQVSSIDLVPDKSLRLVLTSELLFSAGSDELQPAAGRVLRKLVPLLALAPFQIEVVGHSNGMQGSWAGSSSAWQLSLDRAMQVATFLMGSGQLDEDRFVISGRGHTEPLVNSAEDGQDWRNSRVEIILTEKRQDNSVQLLEPVKVTKDE